MGFFTNPRAEAPFMAAERAHFLSARGGKDVRGVQSAAVSYPKTREDSDF